MNLVEKALRRLDTAQQRHQPAAFIFAVVKKFGDDNGGVLVTNLAYSAFVSVFPLLLILVTILVSNWPITFTGSDGQRRPAWSSGSSCSPGV